MRYAYPRVNKHNQKRESIFLKNRLHNPYFKRISIEYEEKETCKYTNMNLLWVEKRSPHTESDARSLIIWHCDWLFFVASTGLCKEMERWCTRFAGIQTGSDLSPFAANCRATKIPRSASPKNVQNNPIRFRNVPLGLIVP